MKLSLSTLALASVMSIGAQATTTNWGVHDPIEVGVAITPVGSFADTYLFSLAGPVGLFSTVVSNNLTTALGISDGMVSLYKEAGAIDIAMGGFTYDGTTGSSTRSYGAITAGDYYYEVSGTGTGPMGGFYTISSTYVVAAPVPEPETYALLLAGLGAMGFILRQRRRN